MRRAGQIVARAHELVANMIRPGITTAQIDCAVEEFLVKNGAIPAFKGYQGYPATVCASVDEVVVHGIPNDEVLKEGSIIGVDIGAFVDGFCGDSAWTYPVGSVTDEVKKLLEVTEKALFAGIEQAIIGNRLSDISNASKQLLKKMDFLWSETLSVMESAERCTKIHRFRILTIW